MNKTHNFIDSLHHLIKEEYQKKDRKLKVFCDWDEVIQPLEPKVYYEYHKEQELFKNYFRNFWKQIAKTKRIITFSSYGSHAVSRDENLTKIKNDVDFYNKAPFLTIAKELLLALEDNLIELTFLSAYNQDDFPNGDERKAKKAKKIFGQFPQVKVDLTPFSSHEPIFLKWQILKNRYPDFDIFIDDNPNIITETQRNLPLDKIFVLPDYEYNKTVRYDNVFRLKSFVIKI